MKKSYFFIDKEKFKTQSKGLHAKIEEMYSAYYIFLDELKGLQEDSIIKFSALELRAGITDKILAKVTDAIEEYRRLFFELGTEILQTSIDDFIK